VQLVPVWPGLLHRVRETATILEECCLPLRCYKTRSAEKHPEPLSCTSRLSVWVVPVKPLDHILIKNIRLGKKNICLRPKVVKFDPRPPQQREIDDRRFE